MQDNKTVNDLADFPGRYSNPDHEAVNSAWEYSAWKCEVCLAQSKNTVLYRRAILSILLQTPNYTTPKPRISTSSSPPAISHPIAPVLQSKPPWHPCGSGLVIGGEAERRDDGIG